MSPLPARFISRWGNSIRLSYDDAVCWHLLLGADAAAQAAVSAARSRLAGVAGLHMTPLQWLHMTVLRAGTKDAITQADMTRMLARAQELLASTAPVTVTLERVFYHPEAIAIAVSPSSALAPVLAATRTATRDVLGTDPSDGQDWTPHLTLCYSTAEQPSAPVIARLGQSLPPATVTVAEVSLVVQDGAEDEWNWRVAGSARLLGGPCVIGVHPDPRPLVPARHDVPASLGKQRGVFSRSGLRVQESPSACVDLWTALG